MLPRVCDGITALNGSHKGSADRVVEEVLVQNPNGGDHYWIKARLDGLAAGQARAAIARAAGVENDLVHFGGARDRHARVQQWFTVPKDAVENPGQLPGAGYKRSLKVLEVRDGAGPMAANLVESLQVHLVFRGAAAAGGYEQGQTLLARLRQHGVPNYCGPAVLGKGNKFAKFGRQLAAGKRLPPQVAQSGPEKARYARAWQGELFNRWLAPLVSEQRMDEALAGAWVMTGLQLPPHKREWVCIEHPEELAARIRSKEAVILGPLFGQQMPPAEADQLQAETDFLSEHGKEPRCPGSRRALRYHLQQAGIDIRGKDLELKALVPVDAHLGLLAGEFLQPDRHLE